jgi:hypothetical protein
MDFKNLLSQLDQLNEAVEKTKTGIKHTAEPGGYGRKDDEDEEGNKVKKDTAPKGRGRPKKNADSETGDVKKYDATGLTDLFGIKKPKGVVGKRSVKHSLKDWIETIDEQNMIAEAGALNAVRDRMQSGQGGALNSVRAGMAQRGAGASAVNQVRQGVQQRLGAMSGKPVAEEDLDEAGLAVQPIGKPGQNFLIKDPANPSASAITTSDPAVVNAAKQGTLSMQKPGASASSTQVSQPMHEEELDEKDIGKHNNATTGFDALVRKLTPKYGVEAAKRIAGAQLKKIKEAEAPQNYAQSSPMSNGGRSDIALESKKGVNPFAKKDDKTAKKDDKAEKIGKKVTKAVEKGAKPDFLDVDKDKNKKESFKQAVADKKKTKTKVKEGMEQRLQAARLKGKADGLNGHSHCGKNYDDMEEARHYHDGFKEGLDECYGQMPILGRTRVGEMGPGSEVDNMASFGARTPELDEMDKTAYMKQQAIKTPGDSFKAFGQTMHDSDVLDEFAFEALDKQLNAILEGKEVTEGMTVSISKGQQGAPDSVSVSAQDGEADQLLSIIKSAGMGLFGGDEQNGYGAPQGSTASPGGIEVVDDHDGMMALMKKLSGNGGETSSSDYADEEGHDEHSHEEDSCNECGMAYESCGCDHGDKEMVDEVESEDQMTYKVAEDNPPDNGSANSTNDEQGNAAANQALATSDAEENADDSEETVSEGEECPTCHKDPCECEDEDLEESYANGADDTFEADIAYMTKVISGGLNKEKSTGQTTAPVIAGQGKRTGVSESRQLNESVNDWKKLAGIK